MRASAVAAAVAAAIAAGGVGAQLTLTTRCTVPGECQTFADPACVLGTEPECGCLPSRRGTLCVECSGRGFLRADGTCTCNHPTFDPNNAQEPCAPVVAAVLDVENVTVQYTRASCGCHESKALGYFKLNKPLAEHRFGEPSPPTCSECLGKLWGPDVGVIAETYRVPPQTCNVYGGPDPLKGPNGWFACSGHGTWQALPAYRCEPCDAGWMLRDTGLLGAGGEPGLTCDACRPFRGPSPEAGCTTLFAPDPVSGVDAECSGHGLQTTEGVCDCFRNGTHGYWKLVTLSAKFTTLAYAGPTGTAYTLVDETVSVQTCAACMDGFSLAEQCKE